MATQDLRPLWIIAARTIVPALVGAFGALAATLAPVYHAAFCAGGV